MTTTTEAAPVYTTRSLTDHIGTNAAWIHDAFPALHESRLKGTPRRWRQTDLTPQQLQALDAEHRDQKRAAGAPAGADSQAPLHLDVLVLLTSIESTASYAARIIQAGYHVDAPRTPMEQLAYIANYAHTLDPADQDTQEIHRQLQQHRGATTRKWAEVTDGQRLKAACPWCQGHNLYFRDISPGIQAEVVVRCESGACNPGDDAGIYHHGNPCWPYTEWAWLANRIDHNTQAGPRTNPTKHAPM